MKRFISTVTMCVFLLCSCLPVYGDGKLARNAFISGETSEFDYAGLKILLPSYWGEPISDEMVNFYAETGEGISYLGLDGVALDGQWDVNAWDTGKYDLIDTYVKGMNTGDYVFEKFSTLELEVAGRPAISAYVQFLVEGINGSGYAVLIFDEENNNVSVIAMLVSEKSEYCYDADFFNILATAEPAEVVNNEAAPINQNQDNNGTGTDSIDGQTEKSNSDKEYEEKVSMFNIYDSFGSLNYDAIVEIYNTSDEALYLDGRSFDIETSDGHLVQTESWISSCPDVILPGERGYFYNQFGTELNDSSVDVSSLVLVPKYTVKKSTEIPHDYSVEDISVRDGTYGLTMTGRVFNDTSEEQGIYLQVVYYDADMNCLGITGTNVYGMLPNEYTSFEVSGMGLQNSFDASQVSHYTVYAREYSYQW